MASPNNYPSGLNLAGTVFENGPETLQRSGAVYFSGGIQWVDTIGGNNANAGTLPNLPVATIAQAITNSAANGVIIVGEGSAESISATQTIALANVSVFGCGSGSSRPRYTCTGAATVTFAFTAAGAWFENFYFPASTAVPTARVQVSQSGSTVKDCYFECGANDTVPTLLVSTANGNRARIEGCSFVVTASRPSIGLQCGNTATTDLTVIDCTFDGGSYGWSDYALKVTGASTDIRIIGGTFTHRSNIGFTVTGTTYQLYGVSMDGTSNVLLTA